MRTPDAENPTPCYNNPVFNREDGASHIQAKPLCLGSARLGVPRCQFIDWCRNEADATVALNGPGSLSGTWFGKLHGNSTRTLKTLDRAAGKTEDVA